jgi:hypothetical protein
VIKSGADAGKDWIEDELSAAGIDTAALYDEWTVIQGAI